LAREVTCGKAYEWGQGEWSLKPERQEKISSVRHVVAYDFGVKRNILNMLVSRGCRVTVVPAATSAEQVLAMKPDGVFLSNGPGDPEPCGYAIEAIKVLLNQKMPIFGICLGTPITCYRQWREYPKNEIWTSWCKPSGERFTNRAGFNHKSKSWL
jgi:carbamoyl-phosphate synthase small subunit